MSSRCRFANSPTETAEAIEPFSTQVDNVRVIELTARFRVSDVLEMAKDDAYKITFERNNTRWIVVIKKRQSHDTYVLDLAVYGRAPGLHYNAVTAKFKIETSEHDSFRLNTTVPESYLIELDWGFELIRSVTFDTLNSIEDPKHRVLNIAIKLDHEDWLD